MYDNKKYNYSVFIYFLFTSYGTGKPLQIVKQAEKNAQKNVMSNEVFPSNAAQIFNQEKCNNTQHQIRWDG